MPAAINANIIVAVAIACSHPDRRGFSPRLSRYTPRTQEDYDAFKARLRRNSQTARAAGKLTRQGVPNGFRGRHQEVEALRAEAADEGWRLAQVICRNSVAPEEMLEVANDPAAATTNDARAAVAMAGLFTMAFDQTLPATMRLKALQTVLPYLVPLPTARQGVKIGLADGLGWLRGLAG